MVWDEYCREHRNQWKAGTKNENELACRSFIELINDQPISNITIDLIRHYKHELNDYPLRRTTGGNSEKSLNELREQNDKRLSHATIANRMGLINCFLTWAQRHQYIESNPLAEIAIKRDKSRRDRDPFNHADLTLIFSQPRFMDGKYQNPWEFWLPVLAIYTGCRIGELCQLRGSDIVTKNDITYFNIHNENGNNLKTKSSSRKIPAHKHLRELGIIELARAKGMNYLFELQPYGGKRGHYPSKRFSTFKKALGFNERKTFHSFRHSFRNALSEADARDSVVSALMGHADESITFKTYGSDATLEKLDEAIQRIELNDVMQNITSSELQ